MVSELGTAKKLNQIIVFFYIVHETTFTFKKYIAFIERFVLLAFAVKISLKQTIS